MQKVRGESNQTGGKIEIQKIKIVQQKCLMGKSIRNKWIRKPSGGK